MKKIIFFMLASFILILNLIWEFSHYRLYVDLTGIPSTTHLIMASLTDLLLVTLIFLIISIFRRNIAWIENPNKADYFIIVVMGFLIAALIEIYSVSNNRWNYTELMPTIFGIGVSPLIQLFSKAIISLFLLKIIKLY